MTSIKMGDSSNEKVKNHMSPKVVLRRLDIPLNGTIKIREITNPGNSKFPSINNDISILTDIVEKVPKDSSAENTPVGSTDQEDSASTIDNNVSVKTKTLPSHVVVKNLLASSKIKMPSNAVIKMISSGNNIKKLTSGMLVKKLPPGAVIKKVSSGILINNMPAGTKMKLMPVGTTVNKVVSDNVIRNGTLQIPSQNIVIMDKCLDSESSNVLSERCKSEKDENEIVTPIIKSVTVKAADSIEEETLTLNESALDVLKSDGSDDITISDRVSVNEKSEEKEKPPKGVEVLSMNGNDPLIRKIKKQSATNTLTPVRISARLKNRKEKFSVKKLLEGSDYTDHLSTKKRKPRQVANMPLSMNNLTSTIHMTKSQLVKTFLAAREKLLVNKDKPKPSKSNTIKHLDFSVELGPEITITRVKNSKSGLLVHKNNHEVVTNDIITITEGKRNKKKVNSVSKVTQTYSSSKLREDENNLLSTSENSVDIKNNSVESEHENDTGSVKSPELIKQIELVESEICEPEIKESLKPKQQKKIVNQPSSEVSLKEQFKQPGQSTMLSHGKKTAKVTPLRQNRTPEISTKIKPVKLSKLMTKSDEDVIPNVDETSLPMKSDMPQVKIGRMQKSSVKRKSEDNFEKYFITKTRICEHNDSLESESEEEVEHLSHFINMKDGDVFPQVESEKNESQIQESTKGTTIYDLIQDISLELPAWNLHILQDTNSFCIAHVARGPVGIPVMKKIIEIDTDYNAKVYVNQAFRSEFHGVYNSYESIRNLILTLDQL